MKDGVPIQSLTLRDQLSLNITYSSSYEEFLACTEAKMDYARWEAMDESEKPYPIEIKARVLVGHRMKKLIEAHIQEAQNVASRKAAKKKGK